MTIEKKVSKDSYVWGHIGVIIYHSLTAIILIMTQYMKKTLGFNSRNVVIVVSIILLIVTLLSLWPILKDYDRIVIE
jgi:uncharacterized membrane protein